MKCRLCILLLAISSSIVSFALPGEAYTAMNAIRRALSSSASWRMTRQMKGATVPLVSSGVVVCKPQAGIDWRVEKPIESLIQMNASSMTISNEDEVIVKKLDELPHYRQIRERVDRFAAGDYKAFDGIFDVEFSEIAGGWKLELEPDNFAMKRLFTRVTVIGGDLVESVRMVNADSSVSEIRFNKE